jgi:DNA repair exonuclease SbcCD ATPase subunit
LDGYGRFNEHVIELKPGLQLILGPNEQGKSTIRNFLIDMLYGQRRGPQLRNFEDANELRRPWNGGDRYAGRLIYVLDDGREIEVQRDFDKKRGSVAVFDRKHMRDITAEFQRLKNREPNFAEEHLGLSKAVFIGAATIGPMSLDDLGDDDALAQIREKIVSLADTSDESGTAECALRILSERIAEIGRPVSHSKKPLPVARARLDRLDQELARARSAAAEIGAIEARWNTVSEQLKTSKRRKATLEDELNAIDRRDRAQRLAEAQRVQTRIDEVTQTCFTYSSVREFPLEQTPDVQRAANAAATARAQADRTSAELAEFERQFGEESATLEADGVPLLVEVAESTEQELSALDGKIVRLRERIEEFEAELSRSRERLSRAQQDLQSLPDFSRLGADPVAWLTQLATSFRVARQSRNAAVEKLKRVREEIARRRAMHGPVAELFSGFQNFPAESREYEVASRVNEDRIAHLRSEIESLRIEADERHDSGPYSLWTAGIFGGVALACVAAAIWFRAQYIYLPAIAGAAAMSMSFARWLWSRKALRKTEHELLRAQEELIAAEREHLSLGERINAVASTAGAASLRELEALHDSHVREESELSSLAASETQLTQEAQEECDQVTNLFDRLQETFRSVGEHVELEEDIDAAAGRAMSRYQEYRDAKRRLGESRDRPAQLQQQIAAVKAELDECQRTEVDRALAVRRVLREAGFREEARYTNVLAALQAYHVRTAQVRDKFGRVAVLRERINALRARLEAEQLDVVKQDEALTNRLCAAGAESIEQWQELAKQAKAYRDAWDERARLQERIDAALRGESIASMRSLVEKEGSGIGALARNIEEVKLDLRKCAIEIELFANEERDLQIALTQKAAGQRSLNEVEEEREEVAARVAELELEIEATACAATLIEEAARDRHARIAPRIATIAGHYLGRITHGAYNEVMVSRELTITVRIPQTAKLSDDPKRLLSKGTADQVYLALRLALVQAMSASGESIPLLLDDPFANYDDARLANALELLTEIGQSHQVLLFTCRQDVARAAKKKNVPVLNI